MEKQQFSHEDLRALFEEAKASDRLHDWALRKLARV